MFHKCKVIQVNVLAYVSRNRKKRNDIEKIDIEKTNWERKQNYRVNSSETEWSRVHEE